MLLLLLGLLHHCADGSGYEDDFLNIQRQLLEYEHLEKMMYITEDISLISRLYSDRLRRLNDRTAQSIKHPLELLRSIEYLYSRPKISPLLLPVIKAFREHPPGIGLPTPDESWPKMDRLISRLEYTGNLAKDVSAETIQEQKFRSSIPNWLKQQALHGSFTEQRVHIDPSSLLEEDEILIIVRGTPMPGTTRDILQALGGKPALFLLDYCRIPDSVTAEQLNACSNVVIGLERPWRLGASMNQSTMLSLLKSLLKELEKLEIFPVKCGPLRPYRPEANAAWSAGLIPLTNIPDFSLHPFTKPEYSSDILSSQNLWVFEADHPWTHLGIKEALSTYKGTVISPSDLISDNLDT